MSEILMVLGLCLILGGAFMLSPGLLVLVSGVVLVQAGRMTKVKEEKE